MSAAWQADVLVWTGQEGTVLGLCGLPTTAPLHPRGCAWEPCLGLVLEVRKPERQPQPWGLVCEEEVSPVPRG